MNRTILNVFKYSFKNPTLNLLSVNSVNVLKNLKYINYSVISNNSLVIAFN